MINENSVSLGIIHRDDTENLISLVESMRDLVQEIVVIDTGSRTTTPEKLSSKINAAVLDGSFLLDPVDCHLYDFAAVRQLGMNACKSPWYMWLDTDDELVGGEFLEKTIRCLAKYRAYTPSKVGATLMYQYTWNEDRTLCLQQYRRERIVHRDDGWYWKRPVHEALYNDDATHYVEVPTNEMRVVHKTNGRGLQNDRNLRILQRWQRTADESERSIVAYYLGDEWLQRGDNWLAAAHFKECLNTKQRFMWAHRALFRLAMILADEHDWPGIVEIMSKYEDYSMYLQTQTILCNALIQLGMFDIAVERISTLNHLSQIQEEEQWDRERIVQAFLFMCKETRQQSIVSFAS